MQPEPEPRSSGEHSAGQGSALGPHCVGRRVVVRRLLRGETGPTGGPAMTDVLGEMLSWGPDTVAVRPDRPGPGEQEVVEIPLGDIVSGKPVPPRARRR